MRAKSGFTLVEILIVVVILGILAAIVIPQFTEASSEAKVSSIVSNLQTLRSQIQLYKIQHNDTLPDVAVGTDDGTGVLTVQLTSKTNQDGSTTGTPKYGPYFQTLPKNPFTVDVTKAAQVKVVDGLDSAMTADDTTGWIYNKDTGTFKINKSGALLTDAATNYIDL